MGTGPLIAMNVMLLYLILGPVVLFAIYVLFDSLENSPGDGPSGHIGNTGEGQTPETDPALWRRRQIDAYSAGGVERVTPGRPGNRV